MVRVFIGVIAALLAIAGAVYVLVPEAALALTGEFILDADAVADVRATYGGMQLGLAVYLGLVVWRERDLRPALMLLATMFFMVGAVRLGAFVAGEQVALAHLFPALFELAVSAVAGWLARQSR